MQSKSPPEDEFDLEEAEIARELIQRGGLHAFTCEFASIAEPSMKFIDNWHLQLICEHLQAVSELQIHNLVISIPPRHFKSLGACVMWPAWHWAEKAANFNWMFASYDVNLCIRDCQRMDALLRSEWFQAVYPEWHNRKVVAYKTYRNAFGGVRRGTSPGSKAVGHGSHIQVIDDPTKPMDTKAKGEIALKKVLNWYDETMSNRYDGRPEDFRRVVIMQRLHENDLAGHCLEMGFEHLCIPFRRDPKITWDMGSSLKWVDPRKPFEVIHKGLYTETAAREVEKKLGTPAAVAAQLQQNPKPTAGGFVDKDWFAMRWVPAGQVLHV